MAKTGSTTSNQNNDVPWSDLNHDVLCLVMMQLGVIDFLSFSGVCKSWRSLALSNTNMFLTSRPPMSMCISPLTYEMTCYLKDIEGREFETILPHSFGRECVGLTRGYLILFGRYTNDFWLVNPITRHQLHFPCIPSEIPQSPCTLVKAILVFSPSLNEWVIVVRFFSQIWFSIAGTGAWKHVVSPIPIIDIHSFKGKIYTLNYSEKRGGAYRFCEMSFDPHPKFTLLETKNFLNEDLCSTFASSVENLYVVHDLSRDLFSFHELDFGEMKWVPREKTREEYAIFHSFLHSLKTCAFKPELWADTKISWKDWYRSAQMWYFTHDFLNVNLIDDY